MTPASPPEPGAAPTRFPAAVARLTGVRPGEAVTVLLSCAYFFCVLAAYFIIRPIREEMAVAGDVENIPWLFTGTFAGMLVAHPIFAAAVSRWPRRRFVTVCYRFFMANLAVFVLLMNVLPAGADVWLGRVFFVWTSVFSLFVVSVFWSFMIDIFTEGQGKRLFGIIGVGGTLGAVLGSSVTAFLAEVVPPIALLWVSLALMECAVACVKGLDRRTGIARDEDAAAANAVPPPLASRAIARDEGVAAANPGGEAGTPSGWAGERSAEAGEPGSRSAEAVVGGTALDGIRRVAASPYLLGICLFLVTFTVGSSFLYGIQAGIMESTFSDPAKRTSVFAKIDLATNVLTLCTQLFLTGRLIKRLGVAATLAFAPLLSLGGFALLGAAPVFAVFVVFQVLRRAGEYAMARPVREVLYTVLPRADRYKAKNFNDTFVYRAGDQIGIWSYSVMGLGMAASAWAMVPVSALWLAAAVWLGRRRRLERGRMQAAA